MVLNQTRIGLDFYDTTRGLPLMAMAENDNHLHVSVIPIHPMLEVDSPITHGINPLQEFSEELDK